MLTVARQRRLANDCGSMRSIASKLEVTAEHYSAWESGRYKRSFLSEKQIRKLARLLGCRSRDIADDRGRALIASV